MPVPSLDRKALHQLVDRGVGIVAYLRRACSALQHCQVGIELGGPGAAFLDQPGAVLGRKRLVRREDEHGTALAELADPPGQGDRVGGPFLEPLAGGIGKSIEVDARRRVVGQFAGRFQPQPEAATAVAPWSPPRRPLDQEDSDSQHNGRRRGEGRDPAGQRNDPARGRGDGGNGGSGGPLKRVALPIPDPLQVVLFAGGLGRTVQPAGSALREDQLFPLGGRRGLRSRALQAFSR